MFPTGGGANRPLSHDMRALGIASFHRSGRSVSTVTPPPFDLRDPPLDQAAEQAAAYAP